MASDNSKSEQLSMDVRLTLFRDAVDNLRMAKQQQWLVAYYVVLLFAGIIGLHSLLIDDGRHIVEGLERIIFTYSGVVVAAGEAYFIFCYQAWMKKYRNRTTILMKDLPAAHGNVWQTLNPKSEKGLMYGLDFVLMFLTVGVVGASVIAWYVTRTLSYTLIALLAAIFVDVLVGAIFWCLSEKQSTHAGGQPVEDSQRDRTV